jgi:hypothetical protein
VKTYDLYYLEDLNALIFQYKLYLFICDYKDKSVYDGIHNYVVCSIDGEGDRIEVGPMEENDTNILRMKG